MSMPVIRLRQGVQFPANVYGDTGIAVTKANGNFTIEIDWSQFSTQTAAPSSPTNNVLTYDTASKNYFMVPSTLLTGGSGGIADAPSDGVQYGRHNAAWTPIVSSGLTDAPSDGTSYGRRNAAWAAVAPLASPALTGTPTAPTATAGTNTTQLATTAFVGAAVSAGGTFVDAPSDGSSYGRLNAGWDKVAPLASPALTGTPTAPTAATGTNTTQIATTAFVTAQATAINIAINGDFRINQMGYVSAATLSAGTYGHDQWKAGASGGDYSFTQLKSSTQITIASGKSLIQPIEDVNVVGGSYVLSWTGTAQARAGVNTLTPSGSYAASPLLITGQTAGTVMSIEFNAGTLGKVKLETGANATPFIMRPYDQELAACQRYFEMQVKLNYCAAFVNNSGQCRAVFLYLQKRAQPTITFSGSFQFNTNSTLFVLTSPTAANIEASGQFLFQATGTGMTGGQGGILIDAASSSVKIDARL